MSSSRPAPEHEKIAEQAAVEIASAIVPVIKDIDDPMVRHVKLSEEAEAITALDNETHVDFKGRTNETGRGVHYVSLNPNIAVRIVSGIARNFNFRSTAWIMSMITLSFGMIMFSEPWAAVTDNYNPYKFAYLASVASPRGVGAYCIGVGIIQIVALITNGTFPAIRFNPYLRALGSAMSSLVWTQIVLGFLTEPGSVNPAIPVYIGLILFDIMSIYNAMLEAQRKRGP